MAAAGFGVWALVAQQMTTSIIGTIVLFFTTRFKVMLVFSFKRLKALFSYGWKILVMSIIAVLYDEIKTMLSACDTYEQQMSVLKSYGVIDDNGKLNVPTI
jgi:O-antigen/teichoic acid export membrane protein